ncbi:CAMK family protein kinase [Tritrichomonas foetus]|uniref:CAMK family protein kinase n=1 Tax=Tritrichomonas foetus TaxID=1144522 RepID=A0A1J4JIW7_9EUKA|nr:CAMK family protein kinase [Tritrichomonas foetus]|eukprot:OHS97164.1 CAMK family protein kinase [Tritrichomonas foetus]
MKNRICFGHSSIHSKVFNHKPKLYMNREMPESYEAIRRLGRGSFADVWLATHKKTNQQVAIKIIDKISTKNDDHAKLKIEKEINIMKEVNHPNIVTLFDVEENDECYFLIMEYLSGGTLIEKLENICKIHNNNSEKSECSNLLEDKSLKENSKCQINILNENKMTRRNLNSNNTEKLSEIVTKKVIYQVLKALEYLHETCHIVHRDLKCENIMFDEFGNAKIIDFGLSTFFSEDSPLLSTKCGSPAFASPEMLLGRKYTKMVDVWSCGILAFALLYGKFPFFDEDLGQMLSKIVYENLEFPNLNENNNVNNDFCEVSPMAKNLIARMLCKNPHERIKIEEALRHPWFSDIKNSMNDDEVEYRNGCEMMNATERISEWKKRIMHIAEYSNPKETNKIQKSEQPLTKPKVISPNVIRRR